MTGIAITMLILFIVVVWGGLAATLIHLQRHPDEMSGQFGDAEFATDEVLIAQEIREVVITTEVRK
ncbi:MAG: methionine/alanine import NSS transporter subunit MetS [Corynebacterium sp.]|uniref:Methionine and alanine importer, small subunit n=1 Tax=Corynebacterium mustelae TaxID=571915 RepID=A0A0G3GWA9_9CORY|nr:MULTISPECIES: methionine/alanine import NSS transporter subunit MetS [Corynebacterium]AKK05471.1 hypothetical protein CMUST_05675 [Corynebacterium mustelae]MDO5097161.1 methionine/alanine import NSS transporter subunit MetS [Corynebacterium sp.]